MNRDLLLIGLSLFTWGIGEGMFTIFQPLYLEQWGATPVQIGAILGAVGVAMALVQTPAGYLSDKIGPRRIMWAAWMTGLLATGLMGWAGSLNLFIAGMLIYGLTTFVTPAMNSYIIRARGKQTIQRALTFSSALYNFGTVTGPLLGGTLGDRLGLQAVYRISAGLFLLSTLIILFIKERKTEEGHSEVTAAAGVPILKNRLYLSFLVLISLALFATWLPQPLTPNFLRSQRGITLAQIGQLGSIGGLSNTLAMLFLGSLKAQTGLLVGQVLLSLYAFLLWRGTGMPWFITAYLFIGGYRLMKSMILAFARPLVNASQVGLAYGLIETVNGGTVILAPIVAGLLYEKDPTLVYLAAVGLVSLSFISFLMAFPFFRRHETAVISQPVSVEQVSNDPVD